MIGSPDEEMSGVILKCAKRREQLRESALDRRWKTVCASSILVT
jgi:hypothetical protein